MRSLLLLMILSISQVLFSQVINGYARVSSIAAGTTFTVVNVNETGDTFEDGEAVIVMQMQDSVIGTNTGNNASFGNLSSIESSGLYEIRFIASHTETAGVPTSITLTTSTTNTYNITANGSVQLITFPSFGSPDYTTTGNFSALDWNGNIGGVLAFEVPGILTLAHDFSSSGNGFRGGNRSINFYSGGSGCFSTGNFIRTSNHTRAGRKGEGIYRTSTNDLLYAKGKLINGGGGGAERINAGGGGGGNFTAGGNGGFGWSCATAPGGGGVGGLDLSPHISAGRIFMGGGGGGGQQNNSASTDGSDGGGIIIIRANEIATSGTCASRTIASNGSNVPNGSNDGQGGGGGGGSIVFQVNTWSVAAACPLSITANGGNGGRVNSSTHAGGGGGGQGAIVFSSAQPTSNVTVITNNGDGGCNNNSNPCNSQASSGAGVSSSGIIGNASGPLPIELLHFSAVLLANGTVSLNWKTASEINNDFFIIERSIDTQNWEKIERVQGAGNSSDIIAYFASDHESLDGLSYYRLTQTDYNGNSSVSGIQVIVKNENFTESFRIYPNPLTHRIIVSGVRLDIQSISIYNQLGQNITNQAQSSSLNLNQIEFDLSSFSSGIYFMKIGDRAYKLQKL